MTRESNMLLSVIVPAFDEAERIGSPLRELDEYLAGQPYDVELLVVDDGSLDATSEVVRRAAAGIRIPLRLLRYAVRRGKGHALKVGFAASRGDWVLFTDADLSTPICETERLLAQLERGAELAIGTRKSRGATIEVRQPWYRERMGRVFTWLVRNTLCDVSDVTCGFKAFRGDIGRDLFAHLRIHDWSFDAELLFLASRRRCRIDEVPVRWADRPGTRVNLLRDALGSLLGLLRIRWNAALLRYGEPAKIDCAVEVWASDDGRTPA